MIWVALWIVLVLGAALVLGNIGLDVYRKSRRLFADLADVSQQLAVAAAPLQEAADELDERREELAVFADPQELRRARTKQTKGKGGTNGARRHNGRHRSDPAPTRFG